MILRLAANAAIHKAGGLVLGIALAVAAAAAAQRAGRNAATAAPRDKAPAPDAPRT